MNARVIHVLYLFFFISLFFSFRAITSISIGMLLVAGLFVFPKNLFSETPKTVLLFIASCIDLFLLSVVSLVYTNNNEVQWEHIRLQSGLLVIPLAVLFTFEIIQRRRQSLLMHYTLLLLAACLYCMTTAIYQVSQGHDTSVFFYHQIVAPVKGHAVYYSVFIFVALLFLLEDFKDGKSLSKALRI